MAYKMVLKHHFEDKKLKEFLKNLPEATMRVGWDKNQYEEDKKGHPTIKTAYAAYLNEVGHDIIRNGKIVGHVVPRPFMSLAAETYQSSWKQAWRHLLRAYIVGKQKSFRGIMHQFCQLVIENIRDMVERERPFAPNRPSVSKRKNGRPPLVDTGIMMDKLTHEVEIKGNYKGK